MSKTITVAEAVVLAEAGFSPEEIKAEFEIVSAGAANVQAKVARPRVEVIPALEAAAAELFAAGRSEGKTKSGRQKVVLGIGEGLDAFRVMVTAPKDYSTE